MLQKHDEQKYFFSDHIQKENLEYLESLVPYMPGPIYWKDRNSVYLGMNKPALKSSGLIHFSDFVGKTEYDLWPQFADKIIKNDKIVIRTGQALQEEGAIMLPNKEVRYYTAIKVPLRDVNNNIIGIIGNYIDITAQKEMEQLKVENKIQKNIEKEQEKFTQLANKVAHDIRSPTSTLMMILDTCTQLPEDKRISLRDAAITIGDIANNLLHHYQQRQTGIVTENEERKPILLSTVLMESLSAKKYQYANLPLKFEAHFKDDSHFVFIKTHLTAFKRTISNLINNAVDAFEHRPGQVDLGLEANTEWVKIVIQDAGKGMSPELIAKIMDKTAITEGKQSGHGIGMAQVWETLDNNHGKMHISSLPGKGTSITLTFPRAMAPDWIAEGIVLGENDTVIILDDDTSIHGAWCSRFEGIIKEHPSVQLKHFHYGQEALDFIQSLTADEKSTIFLLSDYELLMQELNGLDVIAKSKIDRSILVTSHYIDPLVQNKAAKTRTKILPKQLASEVLITVIQGAAMGLTKRGTEKVDAVIVDDNKEFINVFILYAFDDDEITEEYTNPEHFLENLNKYPKETRIYLDNNYGTSKLTGLDVAKTLHDLGYTQLHLLSGEVFKDADIPSYLRLVGKNKLESLKKG